MAPLPTVLLKHITNRSLHYDWLLTDPDDPQGPLWTARTTAPSDQWQTLTTWPIEPIAPHRRIYLTYQGLLTDGRGDVTRIDQGTFESIEWTATRKVIALHMARCAGRIVIESLDGQTCNATLTG